MSLSPTAHKLLAAEIKELLAENDRLKALAKQLLQWNAKYPQTESTPSELDEIITGFETAMNR